jgi:predicted PhzF superfamily epimerase YddE/YHI9
MQVRYLTVDVFTDRPFGGNPLAVIPDARGLSDAQMQAIAREFNYSEQTFVLPPETGGALPVAPLAACVGLAEAALAATEPPRVASVGLPAVCAEHSVERVWQGSIISDAAISSAASKAVGSRSA